MPGLKAIAAAIAGERKPAAALFSSAPPMAAVVARSTDVGIDANAVLQQLLARFGGRGGGKADLAQGAGLTGNANDIMATARSSIERSVRKTDSTRA